MTSAGRRTVQVQPEPEISAVPEAVQNHRKQQQKDDEEDLGIVKRAKESDFTAISMQDQASSSESSSNPDSSLEDYI